MDVIIQTWGAEALVHNAITSEQWMAPRLHIDTSSEEEKKELSLRAIDFRMQSRQTPLGGTPKTYTNCQNKR